MQRVGENLAQDSDYQWLLSHSDNVLASLDSRVQLAEQVASQLKRRIDAGLLPYTLGVFGGWGTGKTTFLALLARALDDCRDCRVIYFNSWKYAGFLEIVPSLVYKILSFGIAETDEKRKTAASRVLLFLGKKYSDKFGAWVEDKVGIDPVSLFKDAYQLPEQIDKAASDVAPELLKAYYTQIDQAQDLLKDALGQVIAGSRPENPVIVLIDELDRCDPDEAFDVLKQVRALFCMRNLPIAFVMCANPEPIGLAIKHRYGLESDAGDYEARSILEKFVDSYQDLSGITELSPLVRALWKKRWRSRQPWVVGFDEANPGPQYVEDVILNASALDVINTGVFLYRNLRVLIKSVEFLDKEEFADHPLLWTIWHLHIANQLDPKFRHDIGILAGDIQDITSASYTSLSQVKYQIRSQERTRLTFKSDKGNTLFAIFRSYFWEHAKGAAAELKKSKDPQEIEHGRLLDQVLLDPHRMEFLVNLCLIPLKSAPTPRDLVNSATKQIPSLDEQFQELADPFGYVLANE
jgi:hypothetical protein